MDEEYLGDDDFQIHDLLNTPPHTPRMRHPSPTPPPTPPPRMRHPSPPPPPTPPHNPPPHPPPHNSPPPPHQPNASDEARLRAQITENIDELQEKINEIQKETVRPPHFQRFVDLVRALDKVLQSFNASFQGVGGGMPQHRLGARVDPNQPLLAQPIVPPPTPSIPALIQHRAVMQSLGTLRTLSSNLSDHATHVAATVGARDKHTGDGASTSSASMAHLCMSCNQVCYGAPPPAPTDHTSDAVPEEEHTSYTNSLYGGVDYMTQMGGGPTPSSLDQLCFAPIAMEMETPFMGGYEASTSQQPIHVVPTDPTPSSSMPPPSPVDTTIRIGLTRRGIDLGSIGDSSAFQDTTDYAFGGYQDGAEGGENPHTEEIIQNESRGVKRSIDDRDAPTSGT